MKWFKKRHYHDIDPDEIFLDAQNIPGFNMHQFEGVIEKPISKRILSVLLIIFVLFIGIVVWRLSVLQIAEGSKNFAISQSNRLHKVPIFGERGIILDRNGKEIVWNVVSPDEPFSRRYYRDASGSAHLAGYVGYPTKDSKGFYWRLDIIGKSGIEKLLNDHLQGKNGMKLVETNALMEPQSENMTYPPEPGNNVTLTIDVELQEVMYASIKEMAETFNFIGGSGVIMDIHTGELLVMTNYPEFDPHIISEGKDRARINEFLNDSRNPFLNRVVSGLYAPGSTMKPFIAFGALQEQIVTPETIIYSTGKIEVPNRFDQKNPAIFRDWRPKGHGPTNIFHAIADSVNTYFYAIGGGLNNQSGIGIAGIEKYVKAFKLAEPTGIDLGGETQGSIPSPEWKRARFTDGNWYLGDTYNSSIGQFGFQVTPLQMVRAISAIANKGMLVTPYVVKDPVLPRAPNSTVDVIDNGWYDVMHQAMRQTVTAGTAQSINLPYVQAAAKTGTAQVGPQNKFINSWSTGFWPLENPRYAFTVTMERGPSTNEVGSTRVMRNVFEYLYTNKPDLLK